MPFFCMRASPGARRTPPATTSALASPKCCACHARLGPTAARATTPQPFRQLPNAAPATQTQAQVNEVLRLPRFHACISKVLRVPRKMGAHSRARDNTPALETAPKCCPCHANASPGTRSTARATISALAPPKRCACHGRWGPTAARATTPQPLRQLPNAAPATQTQAQVREVLRLPRLEHLHLQSAAPATRDGGPQPRARQHPSPLNSSQMLPLAHKRKPRCTKYCACHGFSTCLSKVLRLPAARATTPQPFKQLPNAAPATPTRAQVHEALRLPRFQHLHLQSPAPATRDGGPQPRARQHPSPLNSSQMLPLPRKRKPRCTKYRNAAPATQTQHLHLHE